MVSLPTPPAKPYRRSPFQVALLMVASGGLYVFVWAFWARRWCSATLERDDQPLWKSIALIVPIFDLFLIFDLGQRIKGVAWRANLRAGSSPLGLWGIAFFVLSALYKLREPYWLVCALDFIPIAVLQFVLVRSATALLGPAAAPTRFNPIEWIVVVLGGAMWILVFSAPFLPPVDPAVARAPAVPAVVAALIVCALIATAYASRRLGIIAATAIESV